MRRGSSQLQWIAVLEAEILAAAVRVETASETAVPPDQVPEMGARSAVTVAAAVRPGPAVSVVVPVWEDLAAAVALVVAEAGVVAGGGRRRLDKWSE